MNILKWFWGGWGSLLAVKVTCLKEGILWYQTICCLAVVMRWMGFLSRKKNNMSKKTKTLISTHLLPCRFCLYRQRLGPLHKTSGWGQHRHAAIWNSASNFTTMIRMMCEYIWVYVFLYMYAYTCTSWQWRVSPTPAKG